MRRADGDEDAGFADLEAPQTVDHGDAMNTVFFVELNADFAHFGERHGFVCFIVKIQSRTIVGFVADESVESDDSSVLRRAHLAGQGSNVDRLAHQLVDVVVGRRRHVHASAAAYRREKADFVAGAERSIPGMFVPMSFLKRKPSEPLRRWLSLALADNSPIAN